MVKKTKFQNVQFQWLNSTDIVLLYSSYILVGFFLEFCEKYIYLLVLYCLHSISGNKLNCLKLQFNHNGSIKTSLQKLETHLDTQTQIYTPRFYLVTGPWPKAVVSLTITKWLRYTHNVIFFNIERYLEIQVLQVKLSYFLCKGSFTSISSSSELTGK